MSGSFLYPWVLLLLVAPAGLLYWTWQRPGRRLALPFDHGRPGKGTGWRVLISLMESVPPLLLAVAVVLLAGPQRLGEPRDRRVLTNIEICLDVSGSMAMPFGDGSRYDTAMKCLDDFLTYRQGDAFGLTFFGEYTLHWVPLTSDVSAIRCSPPFMRPENAPLWLSGGTKIGKALRACAKVLAERPEGDRMILLISDGDSFDLFQGADKEIARELKAANIVVYAVIIPGDVERVQDEIVNITQLTGGEAFLAGDPEAMHTIFKRIDQMKQTRVEKTIGETLDDFRVWCLAGLSLAGVGLTSLFGLRYTPW
jgi:Ca-activated chloride channel family protein